MPEIQIHDEGHTIVVAELSRQRVRHRVGAVTADGWRIIDLAHERHLPLVRNLAAAVWREVKRRKQAVIRYEQARMQGPIRSAVA